MGGIQCAPAHGAACPPRKERTASGRRSRQYPFKKIRLPETSGKAARPFFHVWGKNTSHAARPQSKTGPGRYAQETAKSRAARTTMCANNSAFAGAGPLGRLGTTGAAPCERVTVRSERPGKKGRYSLVFLIWHSAAMVAPRPRKKNRKSMSAPFCCESG